MRLKRSTASPGRRGILLAGCAALAGAVPVFSQAPGRNHVVAYWGAWFAPGRPEPVTSKTRIAWFEDELAKHGFVVGENLRVEYAFTGWDTRHEIALEAKRLVAARPDVIWPRLAMSHDKRQAIRAASPSIPIVMDYWDERIAAAEVGDLKRPKGNVTGVATDYVQLSEKRLELVRQLLPKARRVAVISDYQALEEYFVTSHDAAARRLGLEIIRSDTARHGCRTAADASRGAAALDETLAEMLKARPQAFMAFGGIPCAPNADRQLEAFELAHRIPYIHDAGSLGSAVGLGWDYPDHRRRAVAVIAKILKGARPGDIPIETTSRHLLTVNLKRAREIGVEIPESILVRADRIFQ